jgi:hypothetical protein
MPEWRYECSEARSDVGGDWRSCERMVRGILASAERYEANGDSRGEADGGEVGDIWTEAAACVVRGTKRESRSCQWLIVIEWMGSESVCVIT